VLFCIGGKPLAKKRLSLYSGDQFSALTSVEVDWLIPLDTFPVGSTLNRTWIDVRFNQFGTGTLPPEFLNMCGPWIWGLCYTDDTTGSPGIHAEDDSVDWLWREMVVWGPPVVSPDDSGGDHQWVRASQGAGGLRDGKGQRTIRLPDSHLHWCLNLPSLFSNPPYGLYYELFVHTLWTVLD
jgi:hypothetical protein